MTDDTTHSPDWREAVKACRDIAASLTTPALGIVSHLMAMQDVLLSLMQELPLVGFAPLQQFPDTMPESLGVEMGVGPAMPRVPALPAQPPVTPPDSRPGQMRPEQAETRGTPPPGLRPERNAAHSRPLFSLRHSPEAQQRSSPPEVDERQPVARSDDAARPAADQLRSGPASPNARRQQTENPPGIVEAGAGAALLETLAADILAQPSGGQTPEPKAGGAGPRPHPRREQTFSASARDATAPGAASPRAADTPGSSPAGLASGSRDMHAALHHIESLANAVLGSGRSHDPLPAPLAAVPPGPLAPTMGGREITPKTAGAAAPASPLALPSAQNANVVTLIDGLAEQLLDAPRSPDASGPQPEQGSTPTGQFAAGTAAQPDDVLPGRGRGSPHDDVPPLPGNAFDPELERARVLALVAEALQEQARRHGVDLT